MFKIVDGIQVSLTEAEIAEKVILDTDYAAKLESDKLIEYKKLRQSEYPTLVDQLDLMYHVGIDGWKATIKAIKDKYPKPE